MSKDTSVLLEWHCFMQDVVVTRHGDKYVVTAHIVEDWGDPWADDYCVDVSDTADIVSRHELMAELVETFCPGMKPWEGPVSI